MDAAAREMKLDPAELRRRNMIRPEQMPYTNPMAQIYDSGDFEKILDQGLALADWNGFAARRAAVGSARQAARPRHRDLPRMDRRQRARGEGQRRRHARRHHRDLLGDAGDGAGHRDQLRAARGRRLRRADRAHPRRAGRHRPRQRLRQRRLALAVHRRLGGARRVASAPSSTRRRSPARRSRRPPADIEYRAGRFAVVGTDLGIDLFELAGKQPEARIHVDATTTAGGAELAERAATSARSRSTPTPATSRSSPTRRSTTSAASSARRSRAARSTAARCRASARRCASRSSTTPTAASSLTGSFMDYAVPRADVGAGFQHRVRHLDAVPDQPARRQGRRRARHDRRDAGGRSTRSSTRSTTPASAARAEQLQMPVTSERVWQLLRSPVVLSAAKDLGRR